MKVLIAGAGNVGTFVAADLLESGHEVTILEESEDLVERLSATIQGVTWMAGDGCDMGVLAAAGAEGADVVVAATGDDEDNLVISLLCKQEFAVPRVVARVNHPRNRWLFNETWGVDVSVSTPHLLSALVAEAVNVGALVPLLQLDASGTRLVEVTLGSSSPAGGRNIAELDVPRGASVVAVVRSSKVIVPRGDTHLEEGDEVLVLVSTDAEEDIRSILVGKK